MMKGMIFAERYKLEDFIGQGGMSLLPCFVGGTIAAIARLSFSLGKESPRGAPVYLLDSKCTLL